MSPGQNSLDGVWALAEVQGLVAILRDSLRVSTKAEQQAHTLCAGCCTSLMQGSLTPWCKVDGSSPEQQEPQAVCVAPAGCDVQRRGELLLIAQRPQSCREREVREPHPATVHKSTGPRPALSPGVPDVHPPLKNSSFPPRDCLFPSLQGLCLWAGLPKAKIWG